MRELYLLGCLVLGAGAVFATMSVVKYDYKNNKLIPKDISYITPFQEDEEDEPLVNRESAVVHEKDAFSEFRVKGEPVVTVPEKEPEVPQGRYTFQLRGINIVGSKKVALITATPIRTSRTSSRSRSSSSRTSALPVTSSASKVHLVELGEEVDDTGYKVKSIETGKVVLADGAGKEQPPLFFSLVSDESIKRAEIAHKNELSRQKYFSKQNQFPNSNTKPPVASRQPTNNTTNTKPADPRKMTQEQREAEMRKRAENLKAEMKRLKELRESADKRTKDSSKKYKK